MDNKHYEQDWSDLPVKYLIISKKNEYIVFLDSENDLDWQTTDDFDNRDLTDAQKKEYHQVKNEIDSSIIPLNNLDEKVIRSFKIQLGEALIRAFDCDFDNARKMVKFAQDYILKRNIEQSRFMFLTSCAITTASSLSLFIAIWLFRDFFSSLLGETVFYITLSCLIGSLGALLSVILRMGKTVLDYNANKKLHYLEGCSKIVAGMISALIVSLCIKTQILLPIFTKIDSANIAMILGSLIAGASERFAPSIINKLDNVTNKK